MSINCKNCGSTKNKKNGLVRNKQRYKCKECGLNYVEGDQRKMATPSMKAMAVIMYGSGKASYGMIARFFEVSRTAVLYWIRETAQRIEEPEFETESLAIQIDEMWHFLNKKKKRSGYGELLTRLETELSAGLSVIGMLRRSLSCMKN